MDATRFQGLAGVAAILVLAWVFSERRRAISLRMVLGGFALQCGLGLMLLRSETGRRVLDAAAAWVNAVLACAREGAAFLFGDRLVASDGPAGFARHARASLGGWAPRQAVGNRQTHAFEWP